MGLLDYSIRRGISRAVGTVVEDKILEMVAPKAKENIAKNQTELAAAAAGLANAANQATMQLAQNVKICPRCGERTTADKRFCPSCGAALPENTAYEQMRERHAFCAYCGTVLPDGVKFCPGCGAPTAPAKRICAGCGKENAPGIRFCGACGTKME
ncbi:zinc ribbon domain-containing protein [Oscillibacter hominis]|uniref:Zinc ribbon domain-containing protein n=1 Tax=Oscillibacter hominis TaxID=2763056 RepID=A0A7G9B1U6_9FIRM|nr:zinc ribbon domain-containing protein [Oscillibacter hominis]QNL43527.1 zinc ribbon domain-containing protein [Oscillibacter hominis]